MDSARNAALTRTGAPCAGGQNKATEWSGPIGRKEARQLQGAMCAAAWHEAGHALVARELGWWALDIAPAIRLFVRCRVDGVIEVEEPTLVADERSGWRVAKDMAQIPAIFGRAHLHEPFLPESPDARRQWALIGGAIYASGVLSENLWRAAGGQPLQKMHEGDSDGEGDGENFWRYHAASGLPPAPFGRESTRLAMWILNARKVQLDALARALLRHQWLDAVAVEALRQ